MDVKFTSREYPFLPSDRSKAGYVNKREPQHQPLAFHRDRLRATGLVDAKGTPVHNPRTNVNVVTGAVFGMGWSYFRTGDRGFLPLMKGIVAKNRQALRDVGKASARLVIYHPWDLIEELPIWTDEDRLLLTNALLRGAAKSHERRAMHKQVREGAVQCMDENHGTHSAIRTLMGWQYFDKYYDIPAGKYWMRLAKACFDGQSSTFELAEDASGYLTFNPDNSMEYAIRSRDMAYFTRGVARHKARYIALACINNLGFLTGFGDSPGFVPVTGFNCLARAEWFYRDPKLCWIMLNAVPPNAGLRVFGRSIAVNVDVKPVRPDDWTGVIHFPVYKRTINKAESSKKYVWDPKEPVAPDLVNKIVFKQNWDRDGQYLLLDGVAGASYKGRRVGPMGHGHRDANTIPNFTALGRMWLMDHTYSGGVFQNHSGLFVTRDGSVDLTAGSGVARLRGMLELGELGVTLTSIGPCDRAIVWLKGKWFLVMDRVTADKAGEYFARCTFKTLGEHSVRGGELRLTQKGPMCRLITDGRGFPSFESRREQNEAGLRQWIRTAPPRPGYFRQDKLRTLKAGESIVFSTLIHPCKSEEEAKKVKLLPFGEGAVLVEFGDYPPALVRFAGPKDKAALVLGGGQAALEATSLVGGVVKTDGPCDMALDKGGLWIRTLQPRRVTLTPAAGSVRLLRQGPAVRTMDAPDATFPAGKPMALQTVGNASVFEAPAGCSYYQIREWAGDEQISRRRKKATQAALVAANAYAAATGKVSARKEVKGLTLDTVRLDMPVNVLRLADLDGDGKREWVCGGAKGLRVYRPTGERMWAFETKRPVRAVDVADADGDGRPEVAVGCDDHNVYLLDAKGRKRWDLKCPRSFGTLAGPPVVDWVRISDLEGDGKTEVIAGANRLHVLSADGKPKWEAYARRHRSGPIWGDFLLGEIADLDGDGRKEVLVVYDDSYPFLTIYDAAGKSVKFGRDRRYNDGPSHHRQYVWPTKALRAVDLLGGGKSRQIVLATMGYLSGFWPGRVGSACTAFSPKGSFVGMTVFQPDPKVGATLITAGEMTEVRCWSKWRLNKTKTGFPWPKHWARPLGENITGLVALRLPAPVGDVVLVGTARGNVYALDLKNGKTRALARINGAPVKTLVRDGDSALVVKSDGAVLRVRLAKSEN